MRYVRPLIIGLLAQAALALSLAGASDGTTYDDELPPQTLLAPRSPSLLTAIYAPPSDGGPDAEGLLPKLPGVKNPRMSSHVARLAQAAGEAQAKGEAITALTLSRLAPDLRAMANARLMRIDGQGRLQAYVLVATTVREAEAAIEAVQGQVERFDDAAGIVQALVAVGQLETLALQPSVKFIRLPDYGFPGTGSVTTEGDSILGADLVRSAFGVDGSGVRVGVISDGVGGLAASQASGDLPVVNTTTCNVIPDSDPTLSGAEGTAMLEIVHDLAPGAELWFGHFGAEGTTLAFNAAVDCLAANTDIVVDDTAGFNVGPYDGTSSISANTSTELNRSSNPIRAYTIGAGNEALSHYQETYVQFSATSTLHRFAVTATTTDALGIGPTFIDPIFLVSGGIVAVFLQWNDPFGASSNDYDLGLFRDSDGALVAVSVNPQTGSQDPTELVVFQNTGTDEFFDIVIDRFAGSARTFDMFVICAGCSLFPNDAIHNFNTISNSVPNQSDAGGGVISVGAINASDPGNDTIASYSSRGPTNDNRVKPDITGIDCVTVTGVGGFGSPFCGTSAAAPHIAGIAALLLECNPELLAGEPGDSPSGDRAALRGVLLDNAVDLGTAGLDNTYGYGRANASASAAAICADADGDGVPDASDNCPAWPNSDQSLPQWSIPPDDPDCDGFSTEDEGFIGTDPNLACGPSAWPPDHNDDGLISISDVLLMRASFGAKSPDDPIYNARRDLNPDGKISISDVLTMKAFFDQECTVVVGAVEPPAQPR